MSIDLKQIFDAVPGLFLALAPDSPRFTILAATDAYLHATMTERSKIIGQGLSDVFPDNPDTLEVASTRIILESLERAIQQCTPDTVAIQRHDIRQTMTTGECFEERYWRAVNTPVLDESGNVLYLIHRVDDVTENERLRQEGIKQKSLVDELKVSEEGFRLLFENHIAVEMVMDVETGRIVDANKSAVLFYGWPHEELKRMSIDQINMLPIDIVKAEMKNAKTYKKNRFEFCHRLADGSNREVEVFSNKIEIAGKSFLHSIIRDISERKAAEKELRKQEVSRLQASEERFREVLENSLDASYKRNLQTDSYDYLSPVYERITGYAPDEMMTMPFGTVLALVHLNDFPEVQRMLSESMAESASTTYQMEYRFKKKDGQYLWLHDRFTVMRDEDGHPAALIGSVSDITVRRIIEEQLQITLQEHQTILDTANVGIFRMVGRQKVWANRKGKDLFQYPEEEIAGQTMRRLYPSQEAYEQFGRESHSVLSLGQLYETEQKMIRYDGTPLWVRCNGRAIEPTDLTQGIIWILEDITERKCVEVALQKSHDDMESKVLERTIDLEKNNATLTMMLDYARKTEADIQERVVSNLRNNIMNIIDILKNKQLTKSTYDLIELLEATTRNLAHPLARNLESQLLKLTSREMQLANFIRLGKSTKEIMALLNLSANTVETHRNNLRKKLGLCHKKINLRTYLNTQLVG